MGNLIPCVAGTTTSTSSGNNLQMVHEEQGSTASTSTTSISTNIGSPSGLEDEDEVNLRRRIEFHSFLGAGVEISFPQL
jgi:hypothetical protein